MQSRPYFKNNKEAMDFTYIYPDIRVCQRYLTSRGRDMADQSAPDRCQNCSHFPGGDCVDPYMVKVLQCIVRNPDNVTEPELYRVYGQLGLGDFYEADWVKFFLPDDRQPIYTGQPSNHDAISGSHFERSNEYVTTPIRGAQYQPYIHQKYDKLLASDLEMGD